MTPFSVKSLRVHASDTNPSKIGRNGAFWNMLASVLSSLISAILLFVILRLNGSEHAGLFSIASAFAYQALTAGLYGIRNFHAADLRHEFSFGDYFYLRIFSSLLMFACLVYYAFLQGYSAEKAWIVFTFGLFKAIDALEDLFHGEYQRAGRLDLAGYLQTIRLFISLLFLMACLFLTKNLIASFSLSCLLTTMIFLVQNLQLIGKFSREKPRFEKKAFKNLLIIATPLFLSTWLNIYILNAPKYAIDQWMSSADQAIYATLVMPVFTINLCATILYRPFITTLSKDYSSGHIKTFVKTSLIQCALIFLVTLAITFFGWLIGLRLLEIIYSLSLQPYMSVFLWLLAGSGLNTLAIFLTVLLTIMKKQNQILAGYLVSFVFCLLTSRFFIVTFKLAGASWLYVLASLLLIAIYLPALAAALVRKDQKPKTKSQPDSIRQ